MPGECVQLPPADGGEGRSDELQMAEQVLDLRVRCAPEQRLLDQRPFAPFLILTRCGQRYRVALSQARARAAGRDGVGLREVGRRRRCR